MICLICNGWMLDHQLELKKCISCGNTKPRKLKMSIDWSNPKIQVTEHFTVADACTLHTWNRLATEDDGMNTERLIALCQKMEEIRRLLGCPINVHCMFRSESYNKDVVGAIPNDVHAQSLACDFDCNPNLSIQEIKNRLEPVLEKLGIRMEGGTTTWVHIDLHPVMHQRYFNA